MKYKITIVMSQSEYEFIQEAKRKRHLVEIESAINLLSKSGNVKVEIIEDG